MLYSRILAAGRALPARYVTNDELAAELARDGIETSDEWIRTRTGIEGRYIAEEGLTTLELARRASVEALQRAGVAADTVDLIVVATTTPDMVFPSTACRLQAALGAAGCAAFDVQAVCSGFVYALSVADGLIRTGAYRRALVVGAEILSRVVDWKDRSTCVLFGDGAGAVVLEVSDKPGILSHRMHADGSFGEATLSLPARLDHNAVVGTGYIHMNGQQVFKLAVSSLTESAREVCAAAGMTPDAVDVWVPHQANSRIIRMIADKLNVPEEKTVMTVAHHGNTSAASVPLALSEALETNRIRTDDTVLLQGVGAGMTWGSLLLKWI